MTSLTFDQVEERHEGEDKKPFAVSGVHGIYYVKYVLLKDSYEFTLYPFLNGEYTNLRLDFEVSKASMQEVSEESVVLNMVYTLTTNLVEIASNVSKKMVNGNLFKPVIPAEAYDE